MTDITTFNVLVVDDSISCRKILSEALQDNSDVYKTYTSSTGTLALKRLSHTKIDIVFLDIFMPEINGIETLIQIKKLYPDIIVIMISGQTTKTADITVNALKAGAMDFILKPQGEDFEDSLKLLKDTLKPLFNMIRIRKKVSQIKSNLQKQGKYKPSISTKHSFNFSYLLIASSTGGPEALNNIIPLFNKDFPIPILIVQHMPPLFTESLSESLNQNSNLNVIEAKAGMKIEAGNVYIAPGGCHMVVKEFNSNLSISITHTIPVNSCRPSADVLFESVAKQCKDKDILSLILTGMGKDGLEGIKTLKKNPCFCITQSPETCVIYGMPKAIDDANLSDISLPLHDITEYIESLVNKRKITLRHSITNRT